MRITEKQIHARVDTLAPLFDLGVNYAYGNGARLTNADGSKEYSYRMPTREMSTLLDGFDIGVEANLQVVVLWTTKPVLAIRAKDIVVTANFIKFEALRNRTTWETDLHYIYRIGGRFQLDEEGDWILNIMVKRLSDLTEEEAACLTYLPENAKEE